MEQQKTIYQAVKESIDILSAIRVPVADMQTTGVQLLRAVDNLNGCIAAWDQEAARKAAEPAAPEKPEKQGKPENPKIPETPETPAEADKP